MTRDEFEHSLDLYAWPAGDSTKHKASVMDEHDRLTAELDKAALVYLDDMNRMTGENSQLYHECKRLTALKDQLLAALNKYADKKSWDEIQTVDGISFLFDELWPWSIAEAAIRAAEELT